MALSDALLLDPYPVHKWVARRADGIAGTGTLNDPLSANTPDRFDRLLNGFEPLTVVHLGPGEFYTLGYSDGASAGYGRQAKGQMRIIGSGVDVTTLQLAINSTARSGMVSDRICWRMTCGWKSGLDSRAICFATGYAATGKNQAYWRSEKVRPWAL